MEKKTSWMNDVMTIHKLISDIVDLRNYRHIMPAGGQLGVKTLRGICFVKHS